MHVLGALLASLALTAAILETPTIAPASYANVDAGDFIYFTVAVRSDPATGAGTTFVYAVTFRDVSNSSDYTIAWLRYNAGASLPKPPPIDSIDTTLVYLEGDIPAVPGADNVLHTVDALPRGDTAALEVGLRVGGGVEVGQPLSPSVFEVEWWDGPGGTGTRFSGSPLAQPSVDTATPSAVALLSGETLAGSPAPSGTVVAVGGEVVSATVQLSLPEGTMTGAELAVAFTGPGLVFANASLSSVVSTRNPVTNADSIVSTCGGWAFGPGGVLDAQVIDGVEAAPGVTAATALRLPLCNLVNADRDNAAPDTLVLQTSAVVRGDAGLAAGTTTGVSLVFTSAHSTFLLPVSDVVVAVADVTLTTVSPTVVEGILPGDVVAFQVVAGHSSTSSAAAYGFVLEDESNATHYEVTAVEGGDSTAVPNNNNLATLSSLPIGASVAFTTTLTFTDAVVAGGDPIPPPAFLLSYASHPDPHGSRVTELRPPAGLTLLPAPFVTPRVDAGAGDTVLQLGPQEQVFLVGVEADPYPTCVFVGYSPENEDGFCSAAGLAALGVTPEALLDCLPLRVVVPPEGCLRVSPTAPPSQPGMGFRASIPPEFFNTYPTLHSAVLLLDDGTGDAAAPPCAPATYDATTGELVATLCAYGTYAVVTQVVEASPSSTPVPLADRQRLVVEEADDPTGAAVLTAGIVLLVLAVVVLGVVIYKGVVGEWPWATVKERALYLAGDADAIRRRLRSRRAAGGRQFADGVLAESRVGDGVDANVGVPGVGAPSAKPRLRRGRHPSRLPTSSSSSSSSSDEDGGAHGNRPDSSGSRRAWEGTYVNPLQPVRHDRFYYSTAP